MKYTLELTEEELNFLYDRCSRKAARLEEANLKDIPCYRLSWQIMHKISEIRNTKEENTSDERESGNREGSKRPLS